MYPPSAVMLIPLNVSFLASPTLVYHSTFPSLSNLETNPSKSPYETRSTSPSWFISSSPAKLPAAIYPPSAVFSISFIF